VIAARSFTCEVRRAFGSARLAPWKDQQACLCPACDRLAHVACLLTSPVLPQPLQYPLLHKVTSSHIEISLNSICRKARLARTDQGPVAVNWEVAELRDTAAGCSRAATLALLGRRLAVRSHCIRG
jgi:hypothetical protein